MQSLVRNRIIAGGREERDQPGTGEDEAVRPEAPGQQAHHQHVIRGRYEYVQNDVLHAKYYQLIT